MGRNWPRYYILLDRTPMAVDMMTWREAFSKSDRHIGNTDITESCHVSTIFLGLDHNFSGKGDPILFETMIFGGPLDRQMWRYATYDQAERGHAEAVVQARKACAQVKAIADATGLRR